MKRRELSAALLLAGGAVLQTKQARAINCAPAPCYPPTARETAQGVAPTTPNQIHPPGNVLRYGAIDIGPSAAVAGAPSSSIAFTNALKANDEIHVPRGRFKVSNIALGDAGKVIRGESRWHSRLVPGLAGQPIFHFPVDIIGSSYGHLIENLRFELHDNGSNVSCIGVDLARINNSAIRSCRFEGGSKAGASADGVVFAAPSDSASYSNSVTDCNFENCRTGVRFSKNANNNNIFGGEFVNCVTGIDAAPDDGPVDTPKIFGSRIEGCDVGLKECANQGMYFGLRFEDNGTDVDFLRYETGVPSVYRVSTDTHFFGGSTAVSQPCFNNDRYANGLVCLAPELLGNCFRTNSAQRPNEMVGPNVFAPYADTGTLVNPPAAGTFAAYFRGGRVVLDNQQWIVGRDQAGTGVVFALNVNASNVVEIGASGKVDVGNTENTHRTRIFKPSFQFSGGATTGPVINKFPVYDASGSLVGYVPICSS
jgi:hypothetical protein